MMTLYKPTDERRNDILRIACGMAERGNYKLIRRDDLVSPCRTSAGNISRVMGNMDQFRTLLIEYALEHDRSKVIVQAIVDEHRSVEALTKKERTLHLARAGIS